MKHFNIRTKLTLLLVVFGLLPLAAVTPIIFNKLHEMQQSTLNDMQATAAQVVELIDRNLFERYGDVQSFGTNAAAKDTDAWYKQSTTPLVASMNAYMTNYGLYKLMMLVDMDGKVAAVNSVDNKGKPLPTGRLYGQSFKQASWFEKATKKQFVKSDVLDGTVVEQPRYEPTVSAIYTGEDGFSIPFAAPVYDYNGAMIGVWVNFADFGLVESIVQDVFAKKKAAGLGTAAFAIGDAHGLALVNYDPTEKQLTRDSTAIGRKTLEALNIPSASAQLKASNGTQIERDENSGEEDAVGWAKSDGALGFPGLEWTVTMHQPAHDAFAGIVAAKRLLVIIMAVALVVIALIGAYIGKLASRPVLRASGVIKSLADGDYTVEVEGKNSGDELGAMANSLDHLRRNLDRNTRVKQALDNVTSNVMMADENFNIIYMNQAVLDMLKEAEKDIQKDLPRFSVDTLIGSNIDVFHKNPAHQRGMLDKLSKTFKTSILVGGRSFNLVATPVFGQNKERTGTIVEWQDGAATGIVAAITKSQAVIEFDINGKIVTANENFLKVMGYSLEEIQGKHHSLFVEPEYAASPAYKAFWEALGRGEAQIAEFKRLGKGGREVWISASYNPVLDLTGRPVRVVKTATDITNDMARRRETTLLSLVANETDNSVVITDVHERIEYVNPGFTKMTGYTFEEVRGKKPGDVLQGKLTDLDTKRMIREAINAQKPLYTEILNYHKNGDTYWVSLAINPVFGKDGKLERFISIQSNVTATKEKALDFSLQLEAISRAQAVIEFKMDGTIVDANKNFLDTMGYSLDEIKGKHHRMFVEPAYAASAEYRQFWEALNRGEYITQEFKRVAKGGREVYIQASYNAIYDLTGKPIKVVKYANDVTTAAVSRIENEKGMVEAVQVLTGIAAGDLTQQMTHDYKGTFADIKKAVNSTVERLYGMVQKIIEAAQSVNAAASEIASGSTDLSQRTEQQASSLEETAASMEQITGTVKQNSGNAATANELSSKANQVASDGGKVVEDAVSAMGSIERSSQKISDIIGVIDEIAFQTNLLALNAAVEAARAGDAGKGFAVVASEVRSLAGRSASASKEIKALINESASQVKTGAQLVNQAGETLKGIVASVKQVSSIVSEIASASNEQATGIDEINSAITQMDEVTQQNAALVEENTAAATSMVEQARELEKLMSFFSLAPEGESVTEHAAPSKVMTMKPAAKPAKAPAKTASAANGKAPARAGKSAKASNSKEAYDADWQEF